ncbi:hypothetical protein GOBAR_DD25151 [Gossypium barbadense]|nr:hypothetical protein GOBAR_DD25151 [Gossypium barbadense]
MMNAEDAENLYLKSQNPAFRSILSILVMGLRVAASSMDDHNINFNFTGFTPDMPDIVYKADAYASNNALQLTLNQRKQNLRGGDGFAFFIAPNGSKIPPNSGGGHLGLQSYGIVNSPFVAVEFDTFDNPWDPFGLSAHVGIGLNSIETSLTAVKWWWNEIANGGLVNAFITYNSSFLQLWILAYIYQNGSHLASQEPLEVVMSFTLFIPGISALPYKLSRPRIQLSILQQQALQPTPRGRVGHGYGRRNYSRKEDGTMSVNVNREMVTAPRKFSYKELRLPTSNFADEGLLGREVLERVTPNSQQGFKEYESEITTITRLRHRNLVQLIGWCHDNNLFLIVYEFLPNKNLDYHLHREPCILIWDKRYKIAMGLASALFYLQEECNQCVLHRDIKSSNVLLDLSFNAKLGDFGLARLVDHGQGSQTTQVMLGTEGYIAPECRDTYKAIKESDIYSFGIVALEIATGKKAIAVIERNGQRYKTKLVEWTQDCLAITTWNKWNG